MEKVFGQDLDPRLIPEIRAIATETGLSNQEVAANIAAELEARREEDEDAS